MIAAHVWWGDETARQTIIPNACGNITSVPNASPFLDAIGSIRWIIENENRQYYTTTRQVANACWSLKSKSKAENQYSELLLQNNFSYIVLPE